MWAFLKRRGFPPNCNTRTPEVNATNCCEQTAKLLEARVGIEPTNKGFADLGLTFRYTLVFNRSVNTKFDPGQIWVKLGALGAEIQVSLREEAQQRILTGQRAGGRGNKKPRNSLENSTGSL